MLNIDGSYGDGGGQIIRTALTLSAITGKEFSITPIRPKRKKSGLLPQHLMACMAVAEICQGHLEGAKLGSQSFVFKPGKIQSGNYHFDIGTAGSSILLAQTLIPIFLYAKNISTIQISGGTHVWKSPTYDYFENVFLPAISRFGIKVRSRLKKVGYYPKGAGVIELEIQPQKIHGCSGWTLIEDDSAIIRLSRLPRHIADREGEILRQHGIQQILVHEDDSNSIGNSITLIKGFKGMSVLGEKGKKAEQVAEEAIAQFQLEKNNEVDRHLADQLLIYAALADGKTSYTTSAITEHLQTNIFVILQFIERQITITNHARINVV